MRSTQEGLFVPWPAIQATTYIMYQYRILFFYNPTSSQVSISLGDSVSFRLSYGGHIMYEPQYNMVFLV